MTLQLFAHPEEYGEATTTELIAALDSEDFLCQPASQLPTVASLSLGTWCLVISVGLGLAIVCTLLSLVPLWAHASLTGLVWGVTFLVGLVFSWSVHRLRTAAITLIVLVMATRAISALTDLPAMDNHVLLVALLGCGWLMGVTTTPWIGNKRQPSCLGKSRWSMTDGSRTQLGQSSEQPDSTLPRWSLWDLMGLTTWFAVLCWWIPRWEHPSVLIFTLAPSLVGGCILSYLAIQWVWRDHWTARRLAWSALLILVVCALSLLGSAIDQTWSSRGARALAGPLSAMTAQGLCVLAVMAALRGDQSLQSRV